MRHCVAITFVDFVDDTAATRHGNSRSDNAGPKHPRIRLLIGSVLTALVIFFIVRTIWRQWDGIRSYTWHIEPGWLVLSAVLAWLDFVLLFQLWRILLELVSGHRIKFRVAYRVLVLSNLGKYVPGKIWTVMGMVYLLKNEGVPPPPALASTVLHQAFTVIPGAIFVAVVLGTGFWQTLPIVPVVLGLGVSLAILYPPVFERVLNWGLRLFGREPITIRLSFAKAFVLFWAYILAWVIYGASFWCMMWGIGIPPDSFWVIVAAYSAAYLIGFLALFAPGGLGVREGILAVLLAPYLPAGLAAAVAVVSRLWMTIVELLGLVPLIGSVGTTRSKSA